MQINYQTDENGYITSWSTPATEFEPILEIEDPAKIKLGFTQIIDGEIIWHTDKILLQQQIAQLEYHLRETDYQSLKFSEGDLTEEEFAPIRDQRRQWRRQIRALEQQLEEAK